MIKITLELTPALQEQLQGWKGAIQKALRKVKAGEKEAADYLQQAENYAPPKAKNRAEALRIDRDTETAISDLRKASAEALSEVAPHRRELALVVSEVTNGIEGALGSLGGQIKPQLREILAPVCRDEHEMNGMIQQSGAANAFALWLYRQSAYIAEGTEATHAEFLILHLDKLAAGGVIWEQAGLK